MRKSYSFQQGTLPLVAAAIHDGHDTRAELNDWFQLESADRLREEDPFTARWIDCTDNTIVVHHSRFETDVNRPPESAVYTEPEDAWGLQVWSSPLPNAVYQRSVALYNSFYKDIKSYFDKLFEQHDRLIVYDIHSYNHRRESPDAAADAAANPEINLGTRNADLALYKPVIETLIHSFTSFAIDGNTPDVRENVKFGGGYFGKWLHAQYGEKVCPISIEFKKVFMDEWTGIPYDHKIEQYRQMLHQSVDPVTKALQAL